MLNNVPQVNVRHCDYTHARQPSYTNSYSFKKDSHLTHNMDQIIVIPFPSFPLCNRCLLQRGNQRTSPVNWHQRYGCNHSVCHGCIVNCVIHAYRWCSCYHASGHQTELAIVPGLSFGRYKHQMAKRRQRSTAITAICHFLQFLLQSETQQCDCRSWEN